VKGLVGCLLILLVALQYRLWFGDGSVQEVWRLRQEARDMRIELQGARSRNRILEAEVRDLKSGLDAIEERARTDLGMIDSDETFYRFVREQRADDKEPAGGGDALEGGALDGGATLVEEAESRPALHDAAEPTGGGALVREAPRDDD